MKHLFTLITILMLTAPAHASIELGGNHSLDENEVKLAHAALTAPLGHFNAGLRGKYGKTNGIATTNQLAASLDFDAEVAINWSIWAKEQASKNNMDGTRENKFGFGPKFYIYQYGYSKVSMSAGYLNHLTEYEDGSSRTVQRASVRFNAKRKVEDLLTTFTASYQPDIEDSRDYLASAVVEVGFTRKGSFMGVSVEDYYSSVVSEGMEKNHVYTMLKWRYEWEGK